MITYFDPNDRDLVNDVTDALANAGYELTDANDYEPTQADLDEAARWS